MHWACVLLLVAACGGRGKDTEDSPPVHTDETEPDTGLDTSTYPWPVWVYRFLVQAGTAQLFTADGDPGLRVGASLWGAAFGGPAMVAELDHEVRFTIQNRTQSEVSFDFPGVEMIRPAAIAAGQDATIWFRTTQGPGVYIYRVGSDTPARSGLFGLLTLRDPAVFPVEQLDVQVNLVMLDTPLERTEVNDCILGAQDTATTCPSWRPALPGENTALVTQRLLLNMVPQRHGGIPNEFLTTTVRNLDVRAGSAVRINLASLSEGSHTLSLGGLSATHPDSGETVEAITLGEGEATYVMLEDIGPPGAYVLGCTDHDHHGLGLVELTVRE